MARRVLGAVKLRSPDSIDVKTAPRQAQGRAEDADDRSRPNWKLWLCGTAIAVAALLAGCLVAPSFRHQLAVSLWRQPASYTELGFLDAAQLPRSAPRGDAVSFSFAVTNDGTGPAFYPYLVASGSGTQLKPLALGSAHLKPGQVWKVNESIVPSCAQDTCRIQVSLPTEREAIDFTLTLARRR